MEGQNLELQLRELKAAGCEQAFQDQVSGSVVKRPGLDQALAVIGQRDLLVVWRLDRLGRSLPHLIELIRDLGERGGGFGRYRRTSTRPRPEGGWSFT